MTWTKRGLKAVKIAEQDGVIVRRWRNTWAVVGNEMALGKSHPHPTVKKVLYFRYQCMTGENVEQIVPMHLTAFTLKHAVSLAECFQEYWSNWAEELRREMEAK